ncbi:uncharacterized protein BKA55DRAFT_590197 [Fusarium redolens]|uniref:NAD-dependent epimerase/dehydratase domain-containing protein n=1 Tax=Fusarium redolens TaxID=48865 RepID=A0A9P9HWW9_FUSRE|nr:uncharacterized protein BKA55DRAFT_590197 [Fusarium redolens]KAH7264683.1 hypothetical protein BKA55DRAFT_590197 [Fusarium redolens]
MTENRQRSVLVTGANGYIGSAVCRAFVRAGWNTYGLIRNPQAREELALSEIIPVVGAFTDLSFLETLSQEVNTFDTIVSCTEKIPGYAAHFEEVMAFVRKLAERSNENGVRPLVLWSSGCKDYGMTGLHGTPGLAPHTEESPLNGPEMLKERTTNSAKVFDYTDLFDAAVIRPTCVFGYSNSYYGAIFNYAADQREKGSEVLRVPGDPNSIMHATHTLEEVAGAVAKEYGFEKGVQFVSASEAEPSFPPGLHFVFSFSQWVGSKKLRSLTGWNDKRALFSQGIHAHRLAYEVYKGRGHANVAEIQKRIGGNFNAEN